MKANLRKSLFNLHLYAGLVAGVFLLVASVTGIVLAFRTEIDHALNSRLFRVAPNENHAPLDLVVRNARAVHPGGKLDNINLPAAADASVWVRFRDREEVYLDPHTGHVLGTRNKEHTFFYTVEKLHRYLFLGKQGQWITGTATVSLFLMVGTGLYLWLPKSRKALRSALSFNRALKGRAWNVNFHKVTGIYSALVLLISAVTGGAEAVNWVVKTYGHPTAAAKIAARTLRSSGPVAGQSAATVQALWDSARSRMPAFQSATLTWPEKAGGPVIVEYVAADAPHNNALSHVYLDGFTGRVLQVAPYGSESLVSRLYLWTLPLHLGQVGGLAGRIVVIAGSAGLTALVVSGFWLYYRRKINPVRKPVPALAAAGVVDPGSALRTRPGFAEARQAARSASAKAA
jgi:uncharacterized iron-regulated membrane protein